MLSPKLSNEGWVAGVAGVVQFGQAESTSNMACHPSVPQTHSHLQNRKWFTGVLHWLIKETTTKLVNKECKCNTRWQLNMCNNVCLFYLQVDMDRLDIAKSIITRQCAVNPVQVLSSERHSCEEAGRLRRKRFVDQMGLSERLREWQMLRVRTGDVCRMRWTRRRVWV